jgi:hypothetical protein
MPMRRLALALVALLAAAAVAGETLKTLSYSCPGAGLTAIAVKAGIGDVEVLGGTASDVVVSVDLTRKGGGLFGDRQTPREAEAIEIEPRLAGGELTLQLKPEHRGDAHFSERWTVRVPAALAATVKLGVGDVSVLDTSGDIVVRVGVGDVRIEGVFSAVGEVRAASGVGDVTLRTPEGRTEGTGFIGHTLSGHGPGTATVRADAGVGDVTIRLR